MSNANIADDDFNPMEEAYNNTSFNSYIKGPGSNIKSAMHTNTRRKEDGGIIKLHVTNIPFSLKETGLQNIFSEFGIVHSVYISQHVRESSLSKWGFVEYKSFSDAQSAIAGVHNAQPHNLSVKFAMTDKEKEARKKLKESGYCTSTEEPEPMPSGPRGRGRPAGLQGPNPRNLKSSYRPPKSRYDEELQSPKSFSPGRFNPTDDHASLGAVANKTIVCTVNPDGPRKVTHGTSSSIFYHDANTVNIDVLSKQVKERYRQIDDGETYKYGEDETSTLYPPLVCTTCGSAARKLCYLCKSPYCSKTCLMKDWPKHQNICSKDTSNEKGTPREEVQVNGMSNGSSPHDERSSYNKRGFGNRNANIARKPHIKERNEPLKVTFENTSPTVNGISELNGQSPTQGKPKPLMSTHMKPVPPTPSVATPAKPSPPIAEVVEETPPVTPPVKTTPQVAAPIKSIPPPSTPIGVKVNEEIGKNNSEDVANHAGIGICIFSENKNNSEDVANDAGIGFSRTAKSLPPKEGSTLSPRWNFLPSDTFTEVMVTLKEKANEFWVTKAPIQLQADLLAELNEHCNGPDASVIPEPLRYNKCAVLFEGDWYRGRIVDVLPKLVVQLADYGNKIVIDKKNLRYIPTGMLKIPPQAVNIRLAEGTPEKYSNLQVDELIKVKPVSKSGECWVVHVEGVTYPEPRPEPQPIKSPPPRITEKPPSETVTVSPLKPLPKAASVSKFPELPKSPEPVKPQLLETKPVTQPASSSSPNSTSAGPKKSAFSKLRKPASLIPDDAPIPFDRYSKITLVVAVSSSEYWANKTSDMTNLFLMATKLDGCASQSVTPKLGEIYVKVYSDVWCRARVVSLNPLKVFYIDFGNEELVEASDLRPVPVECFGVPAYAFKIKLADGTSRKYFNIDPENVDDTSLTELSVKPACQLADKTLVVMVEGEDYSSVATQGSSQMKHVIDGAGKKVELIVNKVLNEDFIACSMVIPGDLSLEKLTEELAKVQLQPVSKNEVAGNQVVCEGIDGTRGRGYIMTSSESEVRVALTDLARVVIASSLAPLPEDLSHKPEAGVRLILDAPARQFEKGEKLVALVDHRKGDELFVNVENVGEGGISVGGSIGIWSPRVEEAGLPAISIAPGKPVIVSAFQSPRSLYIQSDDLKDKEVLATILQDTAAHTMRCQNLDRKPYTGEVVACRFSEDENYYRAQILKKNNDRYTVIFIDFGNTSEVVQADLKPLDNSLKMVPCSAIKVGLKGVEKDTLNVETASFLNELVLSNTVLFVEYENGDLSQVKLTTHEGLDLNNKVNSLLDPNWKAQLEAGEDPTGGNVFVSSDIKYTVWETGSSVDIVLIDRMDIVLLGINGADGSLDYMCEDFTQEVTKYCESFAPNYSYNPRFNEICLVKFERDGLWYRALCTQGNKTTSHVFFIDFGNKGEVSHKEIRPITPEFASALSILKRIHVYGVPEKLPEAMAKKLKDLFPEDREEPYAGTVVEDRHDGNVVVYFPHVAKVATQIGLSPIVYP